MSYEQMELEKKRRRLRPQEFYTRYERERTYLWKGDLGRWRAPTPGYDKICRETQEIPPETTPEPARFFSAEFQKVLLDVEALSLSTYPRPSPASRPRPHSRSRRADRRRLECTL